MLPVDRALMDRLPGLRAIAVSSVGLDAIDLPEAQRRGIRVTNVAAGATEEVATHAVALLLALQRRLRPYHAHVVAGGVDLPRAGPPPPPPGHNGGVGRPGRDRATRRPPRPPVGAP